MRSLIDIHEETARAHELHGRSFENGSDFEKLGILMEEVGEVAKELVDAKQVELAYAAQAPTCTTDDLRAELVQVASLAIRWIDQLDKEGK